MAKWMYIFAIVALLMITFDEAKKPVFQDETIMNDNRRVFDGTKNAADNNWSAQQTAKNDADHRVFDEARQAADSNYDAVVDETIDPASGDE